MLNQRPGRSESEKRARREALTLAERRQICIRGAQQSPSLGGRWIGFIFDGWTTTVFDPRTNRESALEDTRRFRDMLFGEEVAEPWQP